ncbi:hypothetical protein GCM10018785_20060 [Streptomyces longispororuber]|uniref:Uncharacterized protein n=1 Tax=Streptomyces longispororuber TaxID=68230 RepID=A0A918ZFG8_9ACTN|nr:hypothetical protein [Streptomyces longispororuber]GHE50355.1 hypothetical protein GCM10018785_20060 [Streptomyces longispororuber]
MQALTRLLVNWCPETLRWLLPEDVATLRRFWAQVERDLPSLRGPFAQHVPEPAGQIISFSSFAALVTEWGEVVTEAAERGWGIIGLQC